MDKPLQKFRRRGGPRSRTGCNTCRHRHLRCDETKPACIRCTDSGRTCDGYAGLIFLPRNQYSSNGFRFKSPAAPVASPLLNDTAIHKLDALGMPMHMADQYFIEHFQTVASHAFQWLQEGGLWDHIILQMSQSRPVIHHALVALSAQHAVYASSGKPLPVMVDSTHKESAPAYSLKHYTLAIKTLSERLGQISHNIDIAHEALIACLLFICIEVLLGNQAVSLKHLEAALHIVLTYALPLGTVALQPMQRPTLLSTIFKTLLRFEIQACMVGNPNIRLLSAYPSHSEPLRLHTTSLDQLEKGFKDLSSARDELDQLVARSYDFMRRKADHFKYYVAEKSTSERATNTDQKQQFLLALTGREAHLESLRNWAFAFSSFLKQRQSSPTDPLNPCERIDSDFGADELIVHVLWITYHITFVTFSATLEPLECVYDKFLLNFEEVIGHAEIITKSYSAQGGGKSVDGVRFTPHMNVVQPLFFTAIKCRSSPVRHRAVSLLRVSGKEGIWDGDLWAAISAHVIALEESAARIACGNGLSTAAAPAEVYLAARCADHVDDRESLGPDHIPEHVRVHGVRPVTTRAARTVQLECFRIAQRPQSNEADECWEKNGAHDKSSSLKWEFPVYTLCW